MHGCFKETLTVCVIFVSMVTLTSKFLEAFITTAPLWIERQFEIKQFVFPEIDPKAVLEINIPEKLRLGHKMEHLFKNCLKGQVYYELLAHNIPIKRDNRTIGEMDFLLRDNRDNQILHLELTYKFYLIDPTLGEPVYQLIGPNRNDTFFSKLEKLKNTQFKIPFTAEGKEQLSKLDIGTENIKQEACFKAQLFTPYKRSKISINPLNTNCFAGFWISLDTFTSSDFLGYEYYLPSKDEWILMPCNTVSWMSYNEVLIELNTLLSNKRSPLVWMKKTVSVFEKLFVVWW